MQQTHTNANPKDHQVPPVGNQNGFNPFTFDTPEGGSAIIPCPITRGQGLSWLTFNREQTSNDPHFFDNIEVEFCLDAAGDNVVGVVPSRGLGSNEKMFAHSDSGVSASYNVAAPTTVYYRVRDKTGKALKGIHASYMRGGATR